MNKEFSITFWIRFNKNPNWGELSSDIDFPPIVKDGIQIFFSKRKEKLNVYILHPEIGYRKVSSGVKRFIKKDAFIALTNTDKETKLYINAELVTTVNSDTLVSQIEVGDYIMLDIQDGDSKNINVTDGSTVIVPAKILTFDSEKLTAGIIGQNEILSVPVSRIKV